MCVWDSECPYGNHSTGFSCNPTIGTSGYRKDPFPGEIEWMVLDRSNYTGNYLNSKGLTHRQWVKAMVDGETRERCGDPVVDAADEDTKQVTTRTRKGT